MITNIGATSHQTKVLAENFKKQPIVAPASLFSNTTIDKVSFNAIKQVEKANNTEKTSLKELTSKELPLAAGIEIEMYMPKGMTRDTFVDTLVEKVFTKHSNGEPVYVTVSTDFPDEKIKAEADFANSVMLKQHKAYLKEQRGEELKPEDIVTSEEMAAYKHAIQQVGGAFGNQTIDNNGDTLLVSMGAPEIPHSNEKPLDVNGNKPETWQFLLDASVDPFDRSIEMVSPILKKPEQLKLFADLCTTLQEMNPNPSPQEKLKSFVNDLKTQFKHRFDIKDGTHQILPGYTGDKLTAAGFGSVHVHHDARQMNASTFFNEVVQYYNNQDFIHGFVSPGASRFQYAKPIPKDYIKDLDQAYSTIFKNKPETDNPEELKKWEEKGWDAMGLIFLSHFKNHAEIKYQALNQTNALMRSFLRISEEKEKIAEKFTSEDMTPALKKALDYMSDQNFEMPVALRGKIGKKALSKVTMELRILQSDIDPHHDLTMNNMFQHMALRAKDLADDSKLLSPEAIPFAPAKQDEQLEAFASKFDLKEADLKEINKPFWDAQLWTQFVAGVHERFLHPPDYEDVEVSSLANSVPHVKRKIAERTIKDSQFLAEKFIDKANNLIDKLKGTSEAK